MKPKKKHFSLSQFTVRKRVQKPFYRVQLIQDKSENYYMVNYRPVEPFDLVKYVAAPHYTVASLVL